VLGTIYKTKIVEVFLTSPQQYSINKESSEHRGVNKAQFNFGVIELIFPCFVELQKNRVEVKVGVRPDWGNGRFG
jgi:hypothetical protein